MAHSKKLEFLKGQLKVDKNTGDTSSRIEITPTLKEILVIDYSHSKGNSSDNSKKTPSHAPILDVAPYCIKISPGIQKKAEEIQKPSKYSQI